MPKLFFRGPRLRGRDLAIIVGSAFVLVLGVLGLVNRGAPGSHGSAARVAIGFSRTDRPAPPFRLPALTGSRTVSLTALAGRPVVLNFWSSTCEICKSETPALAAVARSTRGRVTFLGVDTLDERSAAQAFAGRYHVPYQMVFDPSESAGARYGLPGLPVTVFLSPSAKTILGENIGALSPHSLRHILHLLYGTV